MKKYLLLIFIFLLCGCQNYNELNKLGITTAMAIDYNNENNEFEVTSQIIDISKSDSSENFTTFESKDASVQEAIRKIIISSSKDLYTSQLQLLILSKNIVNNHLNETLDFFMRDPDIRDELKVVLARDDEALEATKKESLLGTTSSFNINESLKSSVTEEGVGTIVTLNELTNMYLNPYREIILPSLYITNSSTEPNAKIGTTAIFRDNEFISFLDEDDDKYLSIIKNEIDTTLIKMHYKDGYIVFEPNHLKTYKKIGKNNTIDIIINGFTKVYEINSDIYISNLNVADNIQTFFNNNFEKEIEKSFYNIRDKYNTDIYDFRYLYYKNNKIDTNWYEDVFPNLKINVKANIRLYEKGSIKEAIKYAKKDK